MKQNILPFLPAFLIYLALILFVGNSELEGDEIRYITYGTNLTNGYFISPGSQNIQSGPGYPLLISPLIGMGLPYVCIRLLNLLFMAGALIYTKNIFSLYTSSQNAIGLTYLLALFPTLLKWIPRIHAEALTFFLLIGFIYHLILYVRENQLKSLHLLYAGIFLGWLTLTRYIFLYLIVVLILIYGALFLLKRKQSFFNIGMVYVLAFLIYSPFILHNYLLTNKLVLTGTNGAEILYWRSTPFENEYGDWISFVEVVGVKPTLTKEDVITIREQHREFILSVDSLPDQERSKQLKAKAIENIKNHPVKYLKNTLASFLRLFFNYPRSYERASLNTFAYIIPGSLLLFFTLFSLIISIKKYKEFPLELWGLFLMGAMYLGGITLLNGTARNLLTIAPIVFLFNVYIWNTYVRIKIS